MSNYLDSICYHAHPNCVPKNFINFDIELK